MKKLSAIQKSNVRYLVAFTILSIADLQFTEILLANGSVFEANPLAALFVDNLPKYKATCVIIVMSCLTAASFYRPKLVNRVWMFGTALMGAVCMYSLALLFSL